MAGRRILASLILSTSILAAGCGEYITFSKQSRARGLQYMETNQTEEAKGAFRDAVRQNPRAATSSMNIPPFSSAESL